MKNQNLKQAIIANFACNRNNLKCSEKLEDSVDAGLAFYENLSNGKDASLLKLFNQLIKTKRYKTKMKLIERYLTLMIMCLMIVACAGTKSGAEYHADLQKYYNFESAMSRNTSFTLKSLKDDLKQAKKDSREGKNVEKELERIEQILKKIENEKSN